MNCRRCRYHEDRGGQRAAHHVCALVGLALPDSRQLLGCPLEILPSDHRSAQANARTLLHHAQRQGKLEELQGQLDKRVVEYCRLLLLNTELAGVTCHGFDGGEIDTPLQWVARFGAWVGGGE